MAWLSLVCFTALCDALVLPPPSPRVSTQRSPQRHAPALLMGRKFENNKLKMAKTALAYAKKVLPTWQTSVWFCEGAARE